MFGDKFDDTTFAARGHKVTSRRVLTIRYETS